MKIRGNTVGTPISPTRVEKDLKPVKTVNGVAPDENGNVEVTGNNVADGKDGRGIKSIVRTSGTGAAGTTDTYTITYTDDTTSTFTVYNGKNGTNGKDGTTPHIGANGNWFIGDTDTGVAAGGVGGSEYEIPTFDLAALGLPTFPMDGSVVSLETDTTEIMAALDNGAVKFTIGLNMGVEVQAEVVMNKVSAQGEYICAYTLDFGMPLILTLIFMEGAIQGYLAEIASGGTTQPTAIDLSGLETNGTIVETYADGTTKTTSIEFDANGTPTKITDGDGNVTTLTW